jgi:hypothetical protein
MRFSALASLAVLLAPVLAMPLEARSETSQKLTQELSSLTQASSLLQIWSQNGGAAMNEQEYGARWADFNSATAQVADNIAGAAPLSADDMEEVNGAFETFSSTHVATLTQLSEVAKSKLSASGRKSLNSAVSSNRGQIGTISEYLGNKGLRDDRRFKDNRSEIDKAFSGAISSLN